jgi:hypothetical protein
LKKAGGFRALEQLVFEQCQCKDGQKVMISGEARKIKPGKHTVTKLLWAEAPENTGTPQWSTLGPNAPKSFIELEQLVDLVRW